jgi:hypothetical protein
VLSHVRAISARTTAKQDATDNEARRNQKHSSTCAIAFENGPLVRPKETTAGGAAPGAYLTGMSPAFLHRAGWSDLTVTARNANIGTGRTLKTPKRNVTLRACDAVCVYGGGGGQ